MAKKTPDLAIAKIPLAESQKILSEYLEYIDIMDGEIPDELIPTVNSIELTAQASADRCIYVIEAFENQINYYDELIKSIKEKQNRLNKEKDKIYNKALTVMKNNNILEINGTVKSFKIKQKAGAEAINWNVEFKDEKNIISEDQLSLIPAEYVEEKTVYVVNKKSLSDAIRKGENLECGEKAGREEILKIV
ncbi:siphovirus Gp157 family protein [Fluviispira vulneris]|uniref:siphovirus Gp157 family protein n=1 Tax=Fluviispira vulneris TaxID=2763012 RepID=UPI0016443D6C|nr:siphovirus Gp157 family protein [Fluviispira vulneris]